MKNRILLASLFSVASCSSIDLNDLNPDTKLKQESVASCSSIDLSDLNPYTKLKQGLDWVFRNVNGYIELSPIHHPHTVKYLENLKIKYPDIFSKDISFYILQDQGPAATYQSIYLPISWVEKLEQEQQQQKFDGLYSQATEMILLHEAGHIKHQDMFVNVLLRSALIGSYMIFLESVKKANHSNAKSALIAAAGCVVALIAQKITMEYRADNYAMDNCSDKLEWQAMYEFLARMAPAGIMPGIQHSFKGFRLNRIANAYKEEFGEEMPKTYHESDRVTG